VQSATVRECDCRDGRSMSTVRCENRSLSTGGAKCDGPGGRSRSTVRCERGAGAAASDTYVTINEVKKVPIRIRAS